MLINQVKKETLHRENEKGVKKEFFEFKSPSKEMCKESKGKLILDKYKEEFFFFWKLGYQNGRGFLIWNGCQNSGFQNGVLLVFKHGFGNDFITRISISFLSDFHDLK